MGARLFSSLIGLAWLSAAGAALAQTQPLNNGDPVRALPKAAAPDAGLDISRPPIPADTAPDRSPRFVLTRVEFFGGSAHLDAPLEATWVGYRGKSVGLSDLRSIAAGAEAAYAKAGLPFVAVVVPAQPVVGGVVKLQVVEGRISDLTVLAQDPVARRQATTALGVLVNKSPLAIADVETAYEQAREVPGLAVAGALRRGSQPGGMDLVLDARRTDWRTYANVNNFYAPELGRWGVLVGADYNGASLYGDQSSLQLFSTTTGDQSTVRVSHLRRLNAMGTTVGGAVLYSTASPKGVFQPLDLATKATDARFEVTQPVLRRSALSLTLAAALEVEQQQTRVFRTVALTEDTLRIAIVSARGAFKTALGDGSGSAEIRKGLDFGGASRPSDAGISRPDADPQATVFRFSGEARSRAFGPVRLNARLEVQYTDQSLVASEEFAWGELTLGRGFQPGSLTGDRAVGGSVEARTDGWRVPYGVKAQPFAFVDVARIWNVDRFGVPERTVSSFGGGVRFDLINRARLDVTYAVPQQAAQGIGDKKPPAMLLVNLTLGLDPAVDFVRKTVSKASRP